MTTQTYRVCSYTLLDETREVSFEFLLIFFLKIAHVVSHMTTEDVLSEFVSLQLFAFRVVANKATCTRGGAIQSWHTIDT